MTSALLRRIEVLRGSKSDSGITLIELLVYMFLAIVVLTIIGGILINSLRVETQVRESTRSTDIAQLAAQSLGVGIRNASAIEVTTPVPDTLLIRSRSIEASAAGDWRCNAWFFTQGELRWTSSDTAIAVPIAVDSADSWVLIADGINPASAGTFASLGVDERSLTVAFTVDNGDGAPVLIDTVMVSRQPIPATGKVTAPCF